MSHVLWSVCVLLQKWLNQSRCRLGVDSSAPRNHVLVGITWRIQWNGTCAAAMWPYVKFVWPLVYGYHHHMLKTFTPLCNNCAYSMWSCTVCQCRLQLMVWCVIAVTSVTIAVPEYHTRTVQKFCQSCSKNHCRSCVSYCFRNWFCTKAEF